MQPELLNTFYLKQIIQKMRLNFVRILYENTDNTIYHLRETIRAAGEEDLIKEKRTEELKVLKERIEYLKKHYNKTSDFIDLEALREAAPERIKTLREREAKLSSIIDNPYRK
jgi:hypothetical protein